uniref:polyadenylate-binding protein-interacting protein 2B-like isoform X2 n=1 Tax=Myxine glutinosa TaxID=7769 RepID=UPI00358F2AA3
MMKTPSSSSLPTLAPASSEVHRVPTDTRQAPRIQGHDSEQSALTPVQPPRDDNPFEEFMWMENEEEYNEQVERELCEEEFLERCFQEMLDEEEREWFIPERDLPLQPLADMEQQLAGLSMTEANGYAHSSFSIPVVQSTLNPYAKEFIPGVKY